jgi:putative heme iron utilization protein
MSDEKKDVLRPVDDAARRQAAGLLRSARFAALGTLEASDGAPSVSRVSLATTMAGAPIFLASGLSAHFGNLEKDGRCSLLVGEPGKGDPLAHPRMTLIGRAERLAEGPERTAARARYLMRHPKAQLYVDFPDFAFWRMTVERVSLNGGFGRAYVPKPSDLLSQSSALADLSAMEAGAVAHMNADHQDAVTRYAARTGGTGDGWRLACLDPEGLDLARGDESLRVWFDAPLTEAAALRPTLVALARG